MLLKPQWNSSYHVQVVDDTHVVLVDETDYVVIAGRTFPLVASDLDGTRTLSELAGTVAPGVPFPELLFGLTALREQGYVLESGHAMAAEALAFWHGLNMDASTVATRLEESRV
ncbi:MAG: oxazoline/thiazoline synthase, partial [Actinomycetota bacterium]|nr:oxazoline/thiazoline synthase [Actinomycetota bacterium]